MNSSVLVQFIKWNIILKFYLSVCICTCAIYLQIRQGTRNSTINRTERISDNISFPTLNDCDSKSKSKTNKALKSNSHQINCLMNYKPDKLYLMGLLTHCWISLLIKGKEHIPEVIPSLRFLNLMKHLSRVCFPIFIHSPECHSLCLYYANAGM